jgi:putative ABC transport system permease protein
MHFQIFLSALQVGLPFAFVAIGVYLTFRVLDFPDLTVDGSFPFGAIIAATLIVDGYDPWMATGFAVIGGLLAGLVTAYLHVRFNIMGLLAGILTMTALYSINLRVASFRPNIALLHEETIFSPLESFFEPPLMPVIVLSFLLLIAVGVITWRFLQSQIGLGLRATGANPIMARAQGVNTNSMKLLGVSLSNGFVALGGALFAQSSGFADVNMGFGTIIIGLSSVIIGEVLLFFLPPRLVILSVIGCILGSILYRLAVGYALEADSLGLKPSDLNLITAVIVGFALVLPKILATVIFKVHQRFSA